MSLTSSSTEAGRHHPGLILATLCLASYMATLDAFVVNVALHDIGRGFANSGLSNLSWILNAYAIIFGALLVPTGRLADKIGTKASFVAGLAIFTPASLGLVLTALPPRARRRRRARLGGIQTSRSPARAVATNKQGVAGMIGANPESHPRRPAWPVK